MGTYGRIPQSLVQVSLGQGGLGVQRGPQPLRGAALGDIRELAHGPSQFHAP